MYRQIFSKVNRQVTLNLPAAWADKDVEVLAYPVTEAPSDKVSQELVEARHQRRLAMNRKYSVNFKEMGFKFDRDEANNYSEDLHHGLKVDGTMTILNPFV